MGGEPTGGFFNRRSEKSMHLTLDIWTETKIRANLSYAVMVMKRYGWIAGRNIDTHGTPRQAYEVFFALRDVIRKNHSCREEADEAVKIFRDSF